MSLLELNETHTSPCWNFFVFLLPDIIYFSSQQLPLLFPELNPFTDSILVRYCKKIKATTQLQ